MIFLNRFQCNFIANWRFGLLAVLFCLFFSRLGFWQLTRADEKTQLIAKQQVFAAKAPVFWQSGHNFPAQYQQIRVRGHFSPVTLLLDNQHYQHAFGYDVLSPLILDDGKVILVDRGFVPDVSNRQNFPDIKIPQGSIDIIGSAYYPANKQWALGNIFDKKSINLVVIEFVDVKIVNQFLHKSVYPFIIRMRPESDYGYVRDWPVVAMPPGRHIAYAVQWFAMAIVVLLLFIVLNVKKKT